MAFLFLGPENLQREKKKCKSLGNVIIIVKTPLFHSRHLRTIVLLFLWRENIYILSDI